MTLINVCVEPVGLVGLVVVFSLEFRNIRSAFEYQAKNSLTMAKKNRTFGIAFCPHLLIFNSYTIIMIIFII